jgi:hypothetical protein
VQQRPSAERAASVGPWVGRNACPSHFLHGAHHAPCLEALSPPTGPSCLVPTHSPGPCTPFPPLFGSFSALTPPSPPAAPCCITTGLYLLHGPPSLGPASAAPPLPSLLWGHSHQAFTGTQSFLSTHPGFGLFPSLYPLGPWLPRLHAPLAATFAFGRHPMSVSLALPPLFLRLLSQVIQNLPRRCVFVTASMMVPKGNGGLKLCSPALAASWWEMWILRTKRPDPLNPPSLNFLLCSRSFPFCSSPYWALVCLELVCGRREFLQRAFILRA